MIILVSVDERDKETCFQVEPGGQRNRLADAKNVIFKQVWMKYDRI